MFAKRSLFAVIAAFFLLAGLGYAMPAYALTITFPEHGKVMVGMVLGETDTRIEENRTVEAERGGAGSFGGGSNGSGGGSGSSGSFQGTTTQGSGSQGTNKSLGGQGQLSKEQYQRMMTEQQQAQRVRKALDKPNTELELRKSTGAGGGSSLMIREFEQRKTTPGSSDRESEDRKLKSIMEEKMQTVQLKLENRAEIRNTERGFELKSGDTKVETELPIQIDTETKQLSVTTPQGTKTVTTLPDEAVNTIQSLNSKERAIGGASLETRGEDVVYNVETERSERMFGLLPVFIRRNVEVSAVTGQVTSTQQSFTQRLMDLFSF